MSQRHAVGVALDLARMPALVRAPAARTLPTDVTEIIRIAAGEEDACVAAVVATGEKKRVIVEAARFYLQQILFFPDADCYRVLAIEPDAPRSVARKHMRLLLKWLHPDLNRAPESIYSHRVLGAWQQVARLPVTVRQETPFQSHRSRRQDKPLLPLISRPLARAKRRWSIILAIAAAAFAVGFAVWSFFYLFPELSIALNG